MADSPPGSGADPTTGRPVIVVGYSDKAEGRAALDRAVAEAVLRNAELIVLSSASDCDLQAVRAELEPSGVAHQVRAAAADLDPAEDLINTAEAAGAEFIVIGLRRRSPVGKLLLGGNAQRVLLEAWCPVLAVKAAPNP